MKLFRLLILIAIACNVSVYAQKKAARRNSKSTSAPQQSELTKLRDQYISATKEYKASLQKLVTLYEDSVKKAEQRHEKSEKLFAEGLISKRDVEESERLLVDAKLKVTTTQQQIDGADTQIAQALVPLLVVPDDDFRARPLLRVLTNPGRDFVVCGPGGDERAEGPIINLGEFQPDLVEWAVRVVFTL